MEAVPSSDNPELLVRGLAHRMNNILTVFHGYVGMMLDNASLDESTRDGLSRIKAGARAATELMDRTHSLVRKPALVWREIDVPEFLHQLRPAMESLCGKKTRLFIEPVADEIPKALADSGRLRTAILEIVRNACESISLQPAGGLVRLSTAAGVEGELVVGIHDNGPGFGPEVGAKIFQPFFSTKKKNDATGLGLNVAQGLIKECGGSLSFQSVPGETTFAIHLRAGDAGV